MWFKLVFVAAFVIAAAAATSTARGAARRHGGPVNQLTHEVRGLLVLRAALGLVFYAALGAWLFAPAAFPWAYFPVPAALRVAAAVLVFAAVALLAWSLRTLGDQYRGGVGLYDDHALVTAGPYRVVRHPIHAAFIAIMLCVLPLSASWVLGGSGILLVASIAAVRIPIEERELRERFGAEWASWRDRTGLLLPRLRRA